jgi:hypothetical protein
MAGQAIPVPEMRRTPAGYFFNRLAPETGLGKPLDEVQATRHNWR